MPTTTGKATDLITFSRDTLATVVDSDGKVKWAPHNLLTNSEQFDASSWTRQGLSGVTANSIAAPNGTTTADKITENGSNDFHYVVQTNVIDDSAPVSTLSVFAKAAERQYLNLALSWGANYVAATFDVSGNTVTSDRTGGTGVLSVPPTITPVGGSWYLCTLRGTIGTTGSDAASIALSNTATPTGVYPQYTGTNGHGMHLWGAHLYRSDLGGMQANASAYPYYNPSTPKNLLGYSEAFATSGPWFTDDVTIASNIAVAPNGSLTADSITENTVPSAHLIVQSVAVAAGTYTFSIYAKAPTSTSVTFQVAFGSAASGRANFNLPAGSVGSDDHTSSITPVGDGWFRCAVTVAPTAGTLEIYLAIVTSSTAARLEVFSGTGERTFLLWGAQLSDSASLDPYSPVFGAAPSAAAYHGPRLDYDPVTLAARGLLVEETRTNFLTGANFINPASTSGFTASGDAAGVFSVVSDATALAAAGLPIGNVLKIDNSAGTTNYFVRVNNTIAFGAGSWALSAYVRGSGTFIIDVNAGTWTGTTTPAITSSYQRIVSVGTTNTSSNQMRLRVAAGGVVYVLLMQAEQGAFATSVIPNTGTEITRNADVASVATSQFPYSKTESTLVATFDQAAATNTFSTRTYVVAVFDSGNTRFALRGGDSGANPAFVYGNESTNVALFNATSYAANSVIKAAGAAGSGGGAFYINGAQVGTSALVLNTVDGRMGLGCSHLGAQFLNGHIRQITYIPRRLTNAELQSRTA